MPLDRLQKEGLSSFLGVNLRRDGLTLAEGELARAINADMQTRPGVLLRRRGRTPEFTTALAGPIRAIARHNAQRYHLAGGNWYRGTTSILSGLNAARIQTMAPYQMANATVTRTYLASDSTMRKDDGVTVDIWGITAPVAAPTVAVGAAGNLTGAYRAGYTYARVSTNGLVLESNMSPQSSIATLTSDQLAITVVASTEPQVNSIRIYRTLERGSLFFLDQTVTNASATIASTIADSALGSLVESGHDLPPNAEWVSEFQGAFFLCRDPLHPDYLWYSRRFQVEYWPPENFLKIGSPSDPLQCAIPQVGFLGVFSRLTKYRVFGNHSSGFAYLEALNTRGTPAPQAVLATSRGTLFWARDGIWATNFVAADQELTVAWQPLFDHQAVNDYQPVDWTQVQTFSLTEYKRRLYAGYVDTAGQSLVAVYAQETNQWYFYAHAVRSLYYDEEVDQLLMGGLDGIVSVLEEGTDDAGMAIVQEATLATRSGGDRFVQKRFEYLRLDLHAYTPTTVTVLIDGVQEYVLTITDSRNRRLLRLPADLLGYTWEVRLTGAFDLFAVVMSYAPLEDA